MKPATGPSTAPGYGIALARLRRELRPTLGALDGIAAEPELLDLHEDELARLRYALHAAAERVLGLEPAPLLEEAHAELHVALAIARDETAAVSEALESHGEEAAAGLVWEWRVALFGVRLALRRLDEGEAPAWSATRRQALLPVVLLAVGVAAVLGGALADLWPVWAVGLLVVGASAGLSRRFEA